MKLYTVDHDHPLADGMGRVLTTRHALYAKIGTGLHRCECDRMIGWDQIRVRSLDGDKSNIDPANLAVTCMSCVHRRTHPKAIQPGEVVFINRHGRRSRGLERTCLRCSASFVIEASNARYNSKIGTYCSGRCRSIDINKKNAAARRAGVPRVQD